MLARLERSYQDQRRFVADASHELRTPVAIVRGNVELLRRTSFCEADAAESLRMIEDESLRMTRLLDELLSLARLEGASRHFQPLEARTLMDEIAARARALENERDGHRRRPVGPVGVGRSRPARAGAPQHRAQLRSYTRSRAGISRWLARPSATASSSA